MTKPSFNILFFLSDFMRIYVNNSMGRPCKTSQLTMDTLAFGYVIPAIRAYSGLAPVR